MNKIVYDWLKIIKNIISVELKTLKFKDTNK